MKENKIVHIAIENLRENANIDAFWEENPHAELDGKLIILLENIKIEFNAIIKKELRNHQINQIEKIGDTYDPIIIIADRIFPKIKNELRIKKIAYLEANGNVFLRNNRFFLWLETQKPIQTEREKGNRAFTKTGLKVVYHFLLDPHMINLPYREIANITQVGLGNVNNIFTGLKETGFLLKLNKNQFLLNNKKELLEKWIQTYKEVLQPTLKLGQYKFANEDNFIHWKNIQLKEGFTRWGGEPAGDLLTNHLRPGELTLYTTENRNDILKNYRLIPDTQGDVIVYRKFWNEKYDDNRNAVPAILVYADLMNTGNSRCREVAQIIWDKHIVLLFDKET